MNDLNRQVVPLDTRQHHRELFDCGIPALNVFLQQYAGQKSKYYQANTYVLLDDDNQTIMGYFTLTTARFDWHESVGKRYRDINTTALIARLAVDKRFQGRKIGSLLLRLALEKLLQANQILPVPIITVDAKEGMAEFYEAFGFQRLDNQSNRLFILTKTLLQARNETVD